MFYYFNLRNPKSSSGKKRLTFSSTFYFIKVILNNINVGQYFTAKRAKVKKHSHQKAKKCRALKCLGSCISNNDIASE